jgi:hypothetical protein
VPVPYFPEGSCARGTNPHASVVGSGWVVVAGAVSVAVVGPLVGVSGVFTIVISLLGGPGGFPGGHPGRGGVEGLNAAFIAGIAQHLVIRPDAAAPAAATPRARPRSAR